MKFQKHWILFLALAVVMMACGEKEVELVGIWRVTVSEVQGKNISDGKSFFHFKADGTVDTRSAPGMYVDGNYTQDKEKRQIILTSGPAKSIYNYELTPGLLKMQTTLQNGVDLRVEAVPADALPITKEEEAHLIDSPMPEGNYSPEDSALIDSLRNAGGQ